MDLSALVDDFVEFHNVWVPQVRQGVNLTVHGHLSFFVCQVLLVVGFYRNYVLSLLVGAAAHDRKGSLAHL